VKVNRYEASWAKAPELKLGGLLTDVAVWSREPLLNHMTVVPIDM